MVSLTLTTFSKEISASRIYQDVPISLKFDVSFNNQGKQQIVFFEFITALFM